ncbi:MAG: adenylate/guanylate cyclase domain-containing protein [bacterium]
MSQDFQTKHDINPTSGKPGLLDSTLLFIYVKKTIYKTKSLVAYIWAKGVELFKFLPIKFKLSLIIATIVILVVSVFSLIVLHSQKRALMERMTQVCNVLIQNLSESIKGNLLVGELEKVQEAVHRLKNSNIAGMKQIYIVNHKGKIVAASDKNVTVRDGVDPLKFRKLKVQEQPYLYEFYYPIKMDQKQEDGTVEHKYLGVAFLSFSKKVILTPLQKARNIALGSAFIITLLSIIGIYMIAKKMAYQIQLLSRGAREVGNGNLNVEISVNSKDELGHLATEFNNMIHHLREKLQMQKFMSKLTVQMIQDNVRTDGKNSQAIKRNVAVLFSDVRNFSSVAEKLAPEEIVKLINVYFDLQTRIIENHNGIVDKFMGDQIMAIFQGLNMAHDALRAAVEIQRQMRFLNQERHAARQVTLEMGIGINNGAIVMGHMGSINRMDYTVIGDVVNVAARFCSKAKAGQIITSFELARKVTDSYPTTRLKSIAIKGRTKLIKVCEVDYDRDILM